MDSLFPLSFFYFSSISAVPEAFGLKYSCGAKGLEFNL
jgi:hypothetical protein